MTKYVNVILHISSRNLDVAKLTMNERQIIYKKHINYKKSHNDEKW